MWGTPEPTYSHSPPQSYDTMGWSISSGSALFTCKLARPHTAYAVASVKARGMDPWGYRT